LLTSFPANLGISFTLNKILTFEELLLARFLIALIVTTIVSVSVDVSKINSGMLLKLEAKNFDFGCSNFAIFPIILQNLKSVGSSSSVQLNRS